MTTIQENKLFYDNYDWSGGGEEWADAWGGSDMQWYGSILPRIHLFLPAPTIVEIGAGYGRWAEYFLPYCEELILVDLTQECVETCRNRFAGNKKVRCIKTDGVSLSFISDRKVDFFFSFHSLVHADEAIMKNYACEISKKLTANGVAFLHHSNAGNYVNDVTVNDELLADYRDVTMTAEKMREYAKSTGLRCSTQELINWETNELLDCFSVLARPNSIWGRGSTRRANPNFFGEMAYMGRLAEMYGQGQTPASPPYVYKFIR